MSVWREAPGGHLCETNSEPKLGTPRWKTSLPSACFENIPIFKNCLSSITTLENPLCQFWANSGFGLPFPLQAGPGGCVPPGLSQVRAQCHSPVSWCHAPDLYGRRQTEKRNPRLKRKNYTLGHFCGFSNICWSLGLAKSNIISWIRTLLLLSPIFFQIQVSPGVP